MKKIISKIEHLLELGGTKKDIVLLIISGIALLISIFDLAPLPFDRCLDCGFAMRYSHYFRSCHWPDHSI